jgi:rod shape-determining protein MreB
MRAAVRGREQSLQEPCLVAIDRVTTEVVAVGAEALEMLGRSPERVRVVRPWRRGVLNDYDAAEVYLRHQLFTRLKLSAKPALLLGLPLDSTEVEARAAVEVVREAGAGSVCLLPSLVLGAFGAGVPILDPQGYLLVDLGAGTTEAAVLSLGGVTAKLCVRRGGLDLDHALADYLRLRRFLLVGERSLEQLKLRCCWAEGATTVSVRGRDLIAGLPREIQVESAELLGVLEPYLRTVTDLILQTVEQTPPELVSQVIEHGVVLFGGMAALPGLKGWLTESTGIACRVAPDPHACGLLGCQRLLRDRYSLDVLLAAQGERVLATGS